MTARRPLACLLLLAVAAACARRTEIIGRLPDGAVGDAPVDVPPGVEANGPETGGGRDLSDGRDVPGLALCPSPALLENVPVPTWNCGTGNQWCEGQVSPASFTAAPRAAPGQLPTIQYPLSNSVHPTNLPRITVHWKRALIDQTTFRLRFVAPGVIFDLFVPYGRPVNPGGPIDDLDSVYTVPEFTPSRR
jgi:hypothetical protein